MASLGSSIRSAARATFYAYRRVPVRWRLGGGSAALTFVILAGFASVVGVLTDRQISQEFTSEVKYAAGELANEMHPYYDGRLGRVNCGARFGLDGFARADRAQIRVFNDEGVLQCTQLPSGIYRVSSDQLPRGGPLLRPRARVGSYTQAGYRVEVLNISWGKHEHGRLVYARPLSDAEHTISRLKIFLGVGVFSGTILALLAGLLVAQRAMRPVAELTDVSREIARTRDPTLRLPHFTADDEVSELARTLESMLAALDAARSESEAALDRQREFVADASHELRTPLTSVLANLELLADELEGEPAESAKSALRATRRMRRLVGDLLLLARADVHRRQPMLPTDLGARLTEAAAELGPVADAHDLTLSPDSARVQGSNDDLHRMALNLLENAINHTPPGTQIHAATRVEGDQAVLVVQDNGPGIAPDLQARVFDRFVRGGGDAGDGPRGTGLGLAIVHAVAEAHNASITLVSLPVIQGTRFEIRFPVAAGAEDGSGLVASGPETGSQTSTTTGKTIGRRRSLS